MQHMLLHGAIVPPRTVLEAVTAVVRSVPVPAEVEVAPEPAHPKGLLARLGHRRDDPGPAPVAAAPVMLEHVPVEQLNLPITGFGNLTANDAHRLVEAITEAAAAWSPATLRFAGGTALDFPGDPCVWAKLDGDLEDLMEIGRGVPQCVERLGFFVDRRMFRPMLAVATVTPATTGPYLQQVVDALDAFRGEEWTVDISMLKETFVGTRPELTEFRRIRPGTTR
jgi:2'-5' RNA ligase